MILMGAGFHNITGITILLKDNSVAFIYHGTWKHSASIFL